MKKETKNKLIDLSIQIISVAIGVYLGFMVSNIKDKRTLNTQLSTFENSIDTEINMNKNKIVNVLQYHSMLRDSSRFYLANNIEVIERPAFLKGLKTPNLISSAYKTGIQTGIINALPMNEIQTLNRIYNLQNAYNEYIMASVPMLLKVYVNDQEPNKLLRYLSIIMTDLVIKEEALIKLYETQLVLSEQE